jgi:hypothetical protein
MADAAGTKVLQKLFSEILQRDAISRPNSGLERPARVIGYSWLRKVITHPKKAY